MGINFGSDATMHFNTIQVNFIFISLYIAALKNANLIKSGPLAEMKVGLRDVLTDCRLSTKSNQLTIPCPGLLTRRPVVRDTLLISYQVMGSSVTTERNADCDTTTGED